MILQGYPQLVPRLSLLRFVTLSLFLCLIIRPNIAIAVDRMNILLISSWHKDMPWQKGLEQGMQDEIAHTRRKIAFFVEYMDVSRFTTESQREVMLQTVQAKYQHSKIDVLVAESIPAIQFLQDFPQLLPNAKRLYAQTGARFLKQPPAGFLNLDVDYLHSVMEMLRIRKPKHIYVIGEMKNRAGKERLDSLKLAFDIAAKNVEVIILDDTRLPELGARLRGLPKHSAIFCLPLFGPNAQGEYVTPKEAIQILSQDANAPIFTAWETLMGSGILGGYMLSAELVGKKIIKTILGNNADTLNDSVSVHGFYYDWRQLKKWKISEQRVPKNATVLFREPGLFEEFFWETTGALIAMAMLSILSGVLFLNIERRKRLEVNLQKSQEQLAYMAFHDALTGLPNRTLFSDRLEQAIYQARRHNNHLALLFIDLDRFKEVNDGFGHPNGDKLLQEAAQRLREQLRECDTLARFGGDEFIVILDDLKKPDQSIKIVEKLLQSFLLPFEIDGHKFVMTSSIGISIFPEDGEEPNVLVSNADAAMYKAKQREPNSYCFYSTEMTALAVDHLVMLNDLRMAVDNQEFILLYQPQFDIKTRKLAGVEALIRWHHPRLGMVYPAQFISLAEKTELIHAVGKWVLHEVCQQARKWQDSGLNPERIPISCNLSVRQLNNISFVDTVAAILAETGIEPDLLELEITETAVMDGPARSLSMLQQLHDMGIALAIDDFGIGYSSLAKLKTMPVDRIKIDKSFIRETPRNTHDNAILRAIVALGINLKIPVIAEGVEDIEQVKFLQHIGCNIVQGFLFTRPIAVERFEILLKNNTEIITDDGRYELRVLQHFN